MSFTRSKEKILILITIFAMFFILFYPIKNIGLLFYSQYQNGERCRWINQQRSANSVWVEQNGDYLLSFFSSAELCELTKTKDNCSIKCEFFTADLYLYNPGEEILEQNEKPMASATWLYDKKKESLFIEVLAAEKSGLCEEFGIQNGMVLTFMKIQDDSKVE